MRGNVKINKDVLYAFFALGLICAFYVIADTINGIDLLKIFLFTIKVLIVPMLAIITGRFFIRSSDDQERVLKFLIVIISVSAIIAILQFIGIDAMWNIRKFIQEPTDRVVATQLARRTNVPGLAYYNVQLCYQLVSVLPFAMGMYFYSSKKEKDKVLYKYALIIIIVASVISTSLSAILGIAVSMIVFYFTIRKKIRVKKKRSGLMAFVFLLALGFSGMYDQVLNPDSSAYGRFPLALAAIYSLIQQPWGYGSHDPETYRFISELFNLSGASAVGEVSAHNSFLNTGVSSGIAGLLLAFLIYIYIVKSMFSQLKKTRDSFEIYLYASAIAFMAGYFIQSSTHNAGLFNGDVFAWLILSVVFADVKSTAELSTK